MNASAIYVHAPNEEPDWVATLRAALPDRPIRIAPEPTEDVGYVAAWAPPPGYFAQFPKLRAVFGLGAGVDRFIGRDDLPASIPLYRLEDAGMARPMAQYALYGVLRFQRHFDQYERHQAEARWQRQPYRAPEATRVSVLGLGAIGAEIARYLASNGFAVSGWSRSPKEIEGVACHHGRTALETLLTHTDILVNMLPSTAETRGMFDHALLARLPRGAAFLNLARGDQVDDAALVALLDDGHLRGALLDVFAPEPLPTTSPLWRHPKVLITPHISGPTLIGPAVAQIVQRIKLIEAGQPAFGLVDRTKY